MRHTDQFRAFAMAYSRTPGQKRAFYAQHHDGEKLERDYATWLAVQHARYRGDGAATPRAWVDEGFVDWLCREVGPGVTGRVRVSRQDGLLQIVGLDVAGLTARREQVLLSDARVRLDGAVDGMINQGVVDGVDGHSLTTDLQHDGWDLAAADLLLLHLRGGFAVGGRWSSAPAWPTACAGRGPSFA